MGDSRCQDDPSGKDEARARAAAYLSCLGLPAERAKEEARTAVERCAAQAAGGGEDAARRVLTEVTSEVEGWLGYLCEEAGVGASALGVAAWGLRDILADRPDLFLKRDGLPEAVLLTIRKSAQPAVPEETPAAMPPQSFGHVPAVFTRGFWRGAVQRLGAAARGLSESKREGDPTCIRGENTGD